MMTRAKPELDRDLLHQVDAAYTFARWALGHPQDAENLVEEIIADVPRSKDSIRGVRARVSILRLTRTAARKRVQSERHAHQRSQTLAFADLVALPQGGSNIGARAAGMELKRADVDTLRHAIAALALEQREVMLLRDTHGLSYRDITAIVAIPPETMLVRLGQARDALESCLTSQAAQVDHEESVELMDAYIDSEIDIHTAASFVEHIAHCRGCTSRLLSRSRLVQHIRNVTTCRAPDKLRSVI
jgi:RNA polymerase sigma-70 factor (ECF subfamily)